MLDLGKTSESGFQYWEGSAGFPRAYGCPGDELHNWTRMSERRADGKYHTIDGRWVHDATGYYVLHCGHPTANYPYYITGPEGESKLGGGFRTMKQAKAAVEESLAITVEWPIVCSIPFPEPEPEPEPEPRKEHLRELFEADKERRRLQHIAECDAVLQDSQNFDLYAIA